MQLHIRKVQVQGNQTCIALPKQVIACLEVQKGDYICYHVFGDGMIGLSKFDPHKYQQEFALEVGLGDKLNEVEEYTKQQAAQGEEQERGTEGDGTSTEDPGDA